MMTQSRVLAVAVIVVGGLIGAVTLLDRTDDANTTAVADSSSAETTVAPAIGTTTIASAIGTSTVAATVPGTVTPSTIPLPPDAGCAATGPSAAIDRDLQQAWLCLDGYITKQFPVSTAWSLPDPGVYEVFAKDRVTTSTFGGHISTLKNFVAFTYGENTGARVAFHSIPILQDGSLMQPLDSVGDLSRRGESSGCIRVAHDISVLIWDTLAIGDTVTVLN